MKKPQSVNILGAVYAIEYVKEPMVEDEDNTRVSIGHISYVDRKILVYDRNRGLSDLWDTILHEVVHGIVEEMFIRAFEPDETHKHDGKHDDLGRLANGLSDTLIRNGWIKM